MDFCFLHFLYLFNSKIFVSPGEFELFFGFCFFPEVEDGGVNLLKRFFVELSVVAGEDIVDFKIVSLHQVVLVYKFFYLNFFFLEARD